MTRAVLNFGKNPQGFCPESNMVSFYLYETAF